MWDLAVREEDYAAVDTMLRRYSGSPLSMRILPAYARRDTAARARMYAEATVLDARQSQIAARYVATYLEDLPAAEALARLDLQPRRNAGIRLTSQTFLAWLEIARGRWNAANAAFDAAERMEGGATVRTDRAFAAALPFLTVPRQDLTAIRNSVERWTTADVVPAGTPLATALHPHLRLYLLGLLSARTGELDVALRRATELERLAAPADARTAVNGLVATVRADVAMRRGRPAEALQLLSRAKGDVPLELVQIRPFVNSREYTQEAARFLRAEALLALGRTDEARRWLETSFQGSPFELAYLAPAHQRLARIYDQRGDSARGAAHRRKFEKLWQGGR